MNILLTAINAKYIHSNLAVYCLKAYAGRYSEETQIAEYTINQTLDEILTDLYRHQPDLLCLSCYLWNMEYVRNLLREIPKVLPRTGIWLGGPEVSYNAEEIIQEYPMVCGIMIGEGEETFLELLDYYHHAGKKDSLSAIPGIVYRKEDGTAERTKERETIDLSSVPFVYQDMSRFRNRIIYYESSRGCPFSCSYCLSSVDKRLRFRKMELVKQELQFFIDHEVPQVKFVDRTFNCRHDHAMAVWNYIAEHDKGITNFHFEVAADLLNEEEIRLIRSMRPGLIQLEIGVQSANPDTIRGIHRKMDLEQVKETVGRIREHGNVHQHLDLIAGLPYEDYHSFASSFNCVYAMRPEQLQLGFLKVLKGSPMHEMTEEYGLLYQDRPPYEVLSTRWISYGDVIRLKQIEEMVEVYYNSGQFRNVMEHAETFFPDAFSMYEELASYYDRNQLFRISHSRIARYRILKEFLEQHVSAENMTGLTEWLTYDLYLRDNVKNRPDFLCEDRVGSEEAAAFYKKEEEHHIFLKGYEGYDRRQMRKMTHLERLDGVLYLFDYKKRNPLTGDAAVYNISEERMSER